MVDRARTKMSVPPPGGYPTMQGRITFARELHRDVKTQMLGPDMGDYVLVTTAESDVKPGAPAGAINGGFFPKKPDWPAQYPSIVIGVDDIESAMRRVGKEGGKVLGEPMQIPGVGRYVSFFDTEGNRVSMLQPDRA